MPTKQEYKKAQGTTSENKKRAQLDHLLIDVDFFDKPKIKCLAYEHGQLSVLFLIRIYTALSRATDARIKKTICGAIAYEMRIEKDEAERVISYFITEGLLHSDGEFVESHRVSKDQEALFIKRKKWREAKETDEKDAGSEGGKSEEGGDFREYLNTEELNTEGIIQGGVGGYFPEHCAEVHNNPATKDAIIRWQAHRIRKNKPLDPQSVDALLMQYAHAPAELVERINHSIGSDYLTLYAPPRSGIDPPNKQKKSDLDLKMEAIAKF